MRTIWKYTLELKQGNQIRNIPEGASVVGVHTQGPDVVFWALVENANTHVPRTFRVVGTGWLVDKRWVYLGAAHQPPYVWHVFEVVGNGN